MLGKLVITSIVDKVKVLSFLLQKGEIKELREIYALLEGKETTIVYAKRNMLGDEDD